MPSRRRTSSRRGLRWALALSGLFVVLLGLALLALPFRDAPAHAEQARTDLEAAKTSLTSGDVGAARDSVASARAHTDALQDTIQGVGGDVWSALPLVGGAVDDVRRLGNALDDITAVSEQAADLWPSVDGEDATLFADKSVHLPTLARLLAAVDASSARLDHAESELEEVSDDAPLIGTRLAEARDEALAAVAPVAQTMRDARPLVDALPAAFGADGDRSYLLALLNPSEQRFSGGATLTIAPLHLRDGRLEVGEARDTTDAELYRPLKWRKVKGDRFLRGRQRLSTATYAPDWPVAGEELLRAWKKLTGQEMQGLIAVDVVALGRLLEVTGPAEVPLYGNLTADNFAEKLVGSYDPAVDNLQRKEANQALVPLLADRLFGAGQAREKITSLHESAQGRHLAIWMRDPELQEAIAGAGLAGDLSDTDHDYLAVLNQNTNASKADYWQRRTLRSAVTLREDGSARVRLAIEVHNDSPPYLDEVPDPKVSYFTRWNGMTLLTLLPRGVTDVRAVVAGKELGPSVHAYRDRPYARVRLELPPGATRTAVLEYDVPRAATVDEDGGLTYRLDVTPQGLVVPEALEVTVQWPEGFTVDSDMPDGWERRDDRTAVLTEPAVVSQPSYAVRARS